MQIRNKLSRFLAGVEWRWSLGTLVWGVFYPAGSFAIPAWAVSATDVLSEYGPSSWVAAGFGGLLAYGGFVALYGFGRTLAVRAKYDARFLSQTGPVDPLAKVFEGKRVFLNDFVLPSNPYVEHKSFVDCEVIGPANIYLARENDIRDVTSSVRVDAVVLADAGQFFNGYTFRNCTFRNCTFQRVTLFLSAREFHANRDLPWLNWISQLPPQQMIPGLDAPMNARLEGDTQTE